MGKMAAFRSNLNIREEHHNTILFHTCLGNSKKQPIQNKNLAG